MRLTLCMMGPCASGAPAGVARTAVQLQDATVCMVSEVVAVNPAQN